ncbi:AMP-binding protein [Kribbella solani]|uniref:AMP-binding protein n=1 Tax=Kribbella solani TaxID=236067 RepID=UPI0029B41496|nr:AMP-binding protein [Kribbella solani]MDX2967778.1 AMP-binding protein [Kribbella solani]
MTPRLPNRATGRLRHTVPIRPVRPVRPPEWLLRGAAEVGELSVALVRSGVWRSAGPAQLVRIERALRTYGQSMATLGAVAAIRYPDRPAVISGPDQITYAELDHRCERIAAGLHAEYGIGAGSKVAILCRNHRAFIEATLAASRLGADVLFVNTELSQRQLHTTLQHHHPNLLIRDPEFIPPANISSVTSELDQLARSSAPSAPVSGRVGRITLLTSGTTGVPKGAPRATSAIGLAGLTGSALQRFGLRAGEPTVICPPLFHGLGLLTSMLALFLGSPLVLRPRFDAATLLADIQTTRAGAVVAVPVMLRRLLDLGPAATAEYDLRSLRAVISGASRLDVPLAADFIDRFGPVLCDAYGSSEIGIAAIATSADLIAAPGTVGRPCLGSSIRILDDQDQPVPPGTTGRIFAGGGLVFGGYSDGSSRTTVDGRMSTSDRGHLDNAGRLFIDGREDDMIVSGGENVYPVEVEHCLATHPAVAEAVVVGVPDEEFGQRLVAYVVLHEPATEADLIAYAKANLARYQTPRRVVIVDDLPRNATGKVLRGRLTPPSGR